MSDIEHAYPLILNKVASPNYATPTLRRARLLDWLKAAAECRAAVIAADAGYGKTTLLWQWEREVDFPCYWYKLDRNDRDWTFHISYLIEAVAKRHEGFGRRAHSMLQQLGGPGSSRPGVAAYLLAEMHERLTEPCTFIIDDWQYVNAVTEVRGLWNQILRDAPPTCRFVFASRVKPRLQFARFKTHAGYAELRTDALRFTESEILELFRDIYNDPLAPAELTQLERRTEGWAASLQLVEVSLRERTSPEERRGFIESISATSDSDLFEFLAEEVLDQQTEETRNFLLTTSILQQITPEVAERLAGVHDGQGELAGLENRGLFTSRLDENRYRYHNLFRDFLERRLTADRSEAEVIGLHIHAASYFETTQQWPEAIHHYLRAGLQRQAARLMARHGEEVAASGRLDLVDEWLQRVPQDAIKQNARLSLLHGEACGIRGDWDAAFEALERSRRYFSRKGDKRMEALACLKLSTLYSNFGDTERAMEAADAGFALVPPDDASTRLRLAGNLAITRTLLHGSVEAVVRECLRVAGEAAALGLEHFAAIGYHNAGRVELRIGDLSSAIDHLNRAFEFWAETPTSPFAPNEDLVLALLCDGQIDRAHVIAVDSVRRSSPWPRPKAHALHSLGTVLVAQGRYGDAIKTYREALSHSETLGGWRAYVCASLIEAMWLERRGEGEIREVTASLETGLPADQRYATEAAAALAIADHVAESPCSGECQAQLQTINQAEARGMRLIAGICRVKVRSLALEHRHIGAKREAWQALVGVADPVPPGLLRPWIRRFAPHSKHALRVEGGPRLLARLLAWDPAGWRSSVIASLPRVAGTERKDLLGAVIQNADRATTNALRSVRGTDVVAARRILQHQQASRLFLRSFGELSIRRGSWVGPVIAIEKRRVRALLAVLVGHSHATLTREMATDLLWPEADGDAAVNNLNQTVYQLRRYLDPQYRQGESPEYVFSSADLVSLNSSLVKSDVELILKLPERIANISGEHRRSMVREAIGLIDGEFLADLRYEPWAARLQLRVHNNVRTALLPIAQRVEPGLDLQIAMTAASALCRLDNFDEAATIALAECLALSGRRVSARDLLRRFAEQVRAELGEDPGPGILEAAKVIGVKQS